MAEFSGLALQALGMVLCAGAIYGGIHANQKAMMRDIARQQKEIDKAHDRIDALTGTGRRHGD